MKARPVCGRGKGYMKTLRGCLGSGGAVAMALRAACSGIEIKDYTHLATYASDIAKIIREAELDIS